MATDSYKKGRVLIEKRKDNPAVIAYRNRPQAPERAGQFVVLQFRRIWVGAELLQFLPDNFAAFRVLRNPFLQGFFKAA